MSVSEVEEIIEWEEEDEKEYDEEEEDEEENEQKDDQNKQRSGAVRVSDELNEKETKELIEQLLALIMALLGNR